MKNRDVNGWMRRIVVGGLWYTMEGKRLRVG